MKAKLGYMALGLCITLIAGIAIGMNIASGKIVLNSASSAPGERAGLVGYVRESTR